MSAPHDIDPVKRWLQSETTMDFASEVAKELPRLPVGTAFVASAPLNIAQRIAVRHRRTFNSGATPNPGERKAEPTVLASIDIRALGEKIVASVEELKANDPELLKQRIRELEARAKAPEKYTEEVNMLQEKLAEATTQVGLMESTLNDYDALRHAPDEKKTLCAACWQKETM
jgi:hypothetical protein